MNRFDRLLLQISTALVGGTGLVYAWMLYFVSPVDPYAVVNHPWQPHVQHLHILTAPLLVFAAGFIWRVHIWRQIQLGTPQGRATGLSLALTLVPMIASGVLIQTAVEGSWRWAWVVVHLVSSGLWVVGFLVHQLPMPIGKRSNGGPRVS